MILPTGAATSLLRRASLMTVLLTTVPAMAAADGTTSFPAFSPFSFEAPFAPWMEGPEAASRVDHELERYRDSRATPMFVGGNFSVMAPGAEHTCAIATDGFAYCWGTGRQGVLGNGSYSGTATTPSRVNTSQQFLTMESGWGFTCAVSVLHEVWCWGTNWGGQLGNGGGNDESNPVKAQLPEGAVDLSVSHNHACAIGLSGESYCWGHNYAGQIGNGTTQDQLTPVVVAGGHSFSDIHAFGNSTCAVTGSGGDMYCWGENGIGQLGNGTTNPASVPTMVSGGVPWAVLPSGSGIGANSMCATDTSSDLWCWGADWWGQIGGGGDVTVPTRMTGAPQVTSLTQAEDGYCAIDAGNGLFCWGRNDSGQRGIGSFDSDHIPTQVTGTWDRVYAGSAHTCAVSGSDGYCWGGDYTGQLGIGSALGTSTPQNVSGAGFTDVEAGDNDLGCALDTTNGDAWCWGNKGFLTNFTPTASPMKVTGGPTFVYGLTVGNHHACAIDGTGAAYCWGANWEGVLGDGTHNDRGEPVLVSGGHQWNKISAGSGHTCGVASTGEAYCWGDNGEGKLGTGNHNPSTTPVPVTKPAGVLSWHDIEAGAWLTCGIANMDPGSGLPDRSAFCWGANHWGALGPGVAPDEMHPFPELVAGGHSWKSLAVGWESTLCGVTTSDEAYCWGRGDLGQIGDGSNNTYNTPQPVNGGGFLVGTSGTAVPAIDVGWLHVCARDASDQIHCWGDNSFGQLGLGGGGVNVPTATGVTSAFNLSLGQNHTCAFTGSTLCWGRIGEGALGNGQVLAFTAPQMLATLPVTTVFALGDSATGSIDDPGQVDSYLFSLATGDSVDLGFFADAGSGFSPRIELFDPVGNFELGLSRTRQEGDQAAIITGFVIDESGTWRLEVKSEDGSTGGYTLRTRVSGPVVAVEPFRFKLMAAPEGTSPVDDPFWVYNLSFGSTGYDVAATESYLTVDPTSGTLNPKVIEPGPAGESASGSIPDSPQLESGEEAGPLAMAAPLMDQSAGQLEHTATLDPSGLALGEYWAEIVASTAADPWAGPHRTPVLSRVFEPSISVEARGLNSTSWPVFVEDDGTVLVGDVYGVNRYNPADGSFAQEWDVAGAGHSFFVSGLARTADGRLFASINNGRKVVELGDGGAIFEFAAFDAPARGMVAVGNDLYVNKNDVLFKVKTDGSGVIEDLGRHSMSTSRHYGIAHDVYRGKILTHDIGSEEIYSFDLASQTWDQDPYLVVPASTVWGMVVANSGMIYIGATYDAGINGGVPRVQRIDPMNGSIEDLGVAPDWVLGVALADGELWFSTDEWGLAKMAVPDSAQGLVTLALGDSIMGVRTSGDATPEYSIDLTQGQVVDIGVFNTDLQTGLRPSVELVSPDGNESWWASARRFSCDQNACDYRAGDVLAAFDPPSTGTYTIRVDRYGSGSADGPFVVKTRLADDLVTFSDEDFVALSAVAGGSPVKDTLYFHNVGPAAVAWQLGGAGAGITISPSSGTFPAGSGPASTAGFGPSLDAGSMGHSEVPRITFTDDPAQAPADAIAIEVTFDPSGLSEGDYLAGIDNGFHLITPGDRSWRDVSVGVDVHVHSSDYEILDAQQPYRLWGIHALPDGTFAYTGAGALKIWDPQNGTFTLITDQLGAEVPWDLGEVVLASDGNYYVANFIDGEVYQVTPAGAVTSVMGPGEFIRGLGVGPGDEILVAGQSTVSRLTTAGVVEPLFANPVNGSFIDVAWDVTQELLYYSDGHQLFSYDPADGARALVADPGLGGTIRNIEVGRDSIWVRSTRRLAGIARDGTVGPISLAPQYGLGMTLVEGYLYGTSARRSDKDQDLIWRLPVADGPVSQQTPTPLIAVGDSVMGNIPSGDEQRFVNVELNAGDVIDLGVFSTDLSQGFYPYAGINSPGQVGTSATIRRFACDTNDTCTPYVGRVLAGYEAPETGLYTIWVGSSWGGPGDFVVKVRYSSGMVVTEDDRTVALSAPAGGAATVDTVYIYNTGPTAIAWELISTSVVQVSPTSGTVQPAGAPVAAPVAASVVDEAALNIGRRDAASGFGPALAEADVAPMLIMSSDPTQVPANATALVVTFDPSGLAAGTFLGPDSTGFSIGTPSDPGFRQASMGVRILIHQTEFEVITTVLPTRAWGIAAQPDGQLAVATDGSVYSVDPSTGDYTARVSGLSDWWALGGMAADPVSGELYVANFESGALQRIRADNGVSEAFNGGGDQVRGVDVSPDGTLWVVMGNRITRVAPDGTETDVVTGPANGTFGSAEYDHVNDLLYFADGATVKKYNPADQSVSTVFDQPFFVYEMEMGRSGHLYVRAFASMYEIDPSNGTAVNEWMVPMGGRGMVLVEGALYGTGMQRTQPGWERDWLWRLPVNDGPQPITTKPIVAWADGVTASQGDTVTAAVSIDMSQNGSGIGSFEARMTWDTAVVSFVSVSSDFSGTFTPNTDSTNVGVIRFAGINTNAGANTDTTRLAVLRLVAKGKWGSETILDLDIPELALPDFTNVTEEMDVFNGYVLVSPGTYTVAMRGETSVSKDESKPIKVRAYLKDLQAGIGSIQARVPFDNSVLRVDSVTAGDFGGTFDSNTAMQADSGFVRFAVVQVSPPTVDSTDLATVWVTAKEGTQGGDSTTVSVVFEEIADPVQFADLLPFLVGNESIKVGVTTGIWGDTNKDKKITALDALICLSAVVGKDVSQFDATACDVAPDDGTSFIGKVTALDALATLSFVVGKTLPSTFRVGKNR